MCESGSSARKEGSPSSTPRRFSRAISLQTPHIGSMTPQPDPLEAPPPGPPYRGAREPMFNLPPGTLWLGLGMVAAFGLQSLLEGAAWAWLMNTFAFVSTTFWPPGAALPSLQGLMTLVSHAFLPFDLMNLGLKDRTSV